MTVSCFQKDNLAQSAGSESAAASHPWCECRYTQTGYSLFVFPPIFDPEVLTNIRPIPFQSIRSSHP